MAAVSRIDPIEKDVELLIRNDLSTEARREVLVDFARSSLADAQTTNTSVLGHLPTHTTFVDGREGLDESAVRAEGTIAYEFELVGELFAWIDEQLKLHSPLKSGRYKRSHVFYADGNEADPLSPPPGIDVGTFVNAQPYARKIEAGLSPQHPDGVYEVVAALASRRFGNIARIVFDYRGVVAGMSVTPAKRGSRAALAQNKSEVRYPSIVITVK